MNTQGRTALITGASSGIGKALAENFARDGYSVILSARSVEKLEALAVDLQRRYGAGALVISADLEVAGGAERLHAEIASRGIKLCALANNAGYGAFGEFQNTSLATELTMMQINMQAVVVLTKLFLPDLLANRGKIINTASTAAFQPGPYMAVYYATKAFVLSFSEALAEELTGTGVTVTAFCPGPTASGFQAKARVEESGLVKGRSLPPADKVAAAGYRAMQRGRRVYIHGAGNWLLAESVRFMPRTLTTRFVKMISKPV